MGMLLGLVLVMAAMLWLSTGSSLSPKARILKFLRHRSTASLPETSGSPNNPSTKGSCAQSAEDNQSQPQDSTIYEQTKKIKTQKFHIVREGETLSEISRKYYDSANKWQMILDANRDKIEDVSKLKPGTKLIIPE